MSLTNHVMKINQIYNTMRKNYISFRKMFKNHAVIVQKAVLSEEIFMDAIKLAIQKMYETQDHRKFNAIVKSLKNGKK